MIRFRLLVQVHRLGAECPGCKDGHEWQNGVIEYDSSKNEYKIEYLICPKIEMEMLQSWRNSLKADAER